MGTGEGRGGLCFVFSLSHEVTLTALLDVAWNMPVRPSATQVQYGFLSQSVEWMGTPAFQLSLWTMPPQHQCWMLPHQLFEVLYNGDRGPGMRVTLPKRRLSIGSVTTAFWGRWSFLRFNSQIRNAYVTWNNLKENKGAEPQAFYLI